MITLTFSIAHLCSEIAVDLSNNRGDLLHGRTWSTLHLIILHGAPVVSVHPNMTTLKMHTDL